MIPVPQQPGAWRDAVDVVYVAVSAHDARLARICIASIRHAYPDVPIRVLAGGRLQPGLADELARHWNVALADLPPGDYGWGFVKLEPLFGPPGERFLVCDADTVFTGPVLDHRTGSAPFLVNDETLADDDLRRLYYDWDRLSSLDPDTVARPRAFNSGQWFGTAGVVPREAFDPWLRWTMPRRLRHPEVFMGGDQGILNHVLLQREARGKLAIDRAPIMRWPPHGMDDLTPEAVASGRAPARVVHWAGVKATLLRDMPGGALLAWFESLYYARMPMGRLRHARDLLRHVAGQAWRRASLPLRLRWRRWRDGRNERAAVAATDGGGR